MRITLQDLPSAIADNYKDVAIVRGYQNFTNGLVSYVIYTKTKKDRWQRQRQNGKWIFKSFSRS